MAKFMDVHDGFVGVTREQLRDAHNADLAIEDSEGVHFERAWLDPELGKVFCLATGPTRGDPGHAQNWGQIPQDVRDYLTSIGLNPGLACNPNRSTFGT